MTKDKFSMANTQSGRSELSMPMPARLSRWSGRRAEGKPWPRPSVVRALLVQQHQRKAERGRKKQPKANGEKQRARILSPHAALIAAEGDLPDQIKNKMSSDSCTHTNTVTLGHIGCSRTSGGNGVQCRKVRRCPPGCPHCAGGQHRSAQRRSGPASLPDRPTQTI